jgi:hypothetical protein
MPLKRRHSKRNRHGKRRPHRGGGLGQSYSSPGAPLIAGVDTGLSWKTMSSCVAAERPGMASVTPGGLPGMGGGGRRHTRGTKRGMRQHRRRSLKQRGGSYGFDLTRTITGGAALGGNGNYAPVIRLGCENPAGVNTAPAGAIPKVQAGGASPLSPSPFQGAGPDNVAYYAPTAGYGNQPSSWVSSVGAPVQLQVPYDARALNPACLKTGGGRKRSRRGSRRSRRAHTRRRR